MEVFSFGPFRLDPSRRILRKNDTVVTLGVALFDLLVAMVDQHGEVLTPDELMAIAGLRWLSTNPICGGVLCGLS